MAVVWDRSAHSGSELLMLLAIADFSDDEGRAYPSVATLAAKCRTSPRYAMKLLDALNASGELEVRKNQGPMGRGGRTNLYRVVVERLKPQDEKVVNQSSPLHQSSPLNPSARSGEPGFREVVNQSSPKPSENRQEPSKVARKRAAAFDASTIELPEWLPRAVWVDWVADRAERRKPISSRAAAQQIKRLGEFRDQGHDPSAVIGHSIGNGYQGLFAPPKNEAQSTGARPARRPALDADELFTGADA